MTTRKKGAKRTPPALPRGLQGPGRQALRERRHDGSSPRAGHPDVSDLQLAHEDPSCRVHQRGGESAPRRKRPTQARADRAKGRACTTKKGVGILREEPEVKYAFIEQNVCEVSVVRQCAWLGVSSSGYYDWLARRARPRERDERRAIIDEAVRIAFEGERARYGSPRLSVELNESGFAIAENTVAASLRRQGLVAKAGRKFKATTSSAHALTVAPNLLAQDFTCKAVNEKWCGDITYLWCDEGWMYLATVIDLFSRRRDRLVAESSDDQAARLRRDVDGVRLERRCRGRDHAHRPWKPVLLRAVPAAFERARCSFEHERQGRLLRQCVRGEFLPFAEGRGDTR